MVDGTHLDFSLISRLNFLVSHTFEKLAFFLSLVSPLRMRI